MAIVLSQTEQVKVCVCNLQLSSGQFFLKKRKYASMKSFHLQTRSHFFFKHHATATKDRGIDVLIIMEYCEHGNMLDFLRARRDKFCPLTATASNNNNPDAELTLIDLVTWAHEVAKGMQFLASRKVLDRLKFCMHTATLGNSY